jgi:hypothetical protein
MNKVDEIINKVKKESSVDNFDYNLKKSFEDLLMEMINDVRLYKGVKNDINKIKNPDDWCTFKQESIATSLEKKYLN